MSHPHLETANSQAPEPTATPASPSPAFLLKYSSTSMKKSKQARVYEPRDCGEDSADGSPGEFHSFGSDSSDEYMSVYQGEEDMEEPSSQGRSQGTFRHKPSLLKDLSQGESKLAQYEAQAHRKYRIMGPDDVYTQLQKEKEENKKQVRPTQMVRKNINNAKLLIENSPTLGKDSLEKSEISSVHNTSMHCLRDTASSFKVGAVNESQVQDSKSEEQRTEMSGSDEKNNELLLPDLLGCHFQRIISTCFFQHEQPHPLHEPYIKYKYELTDSELTINNSYSIPFAHISKIKFIYSQLNRPQIRITYSARPLVYNYEDSRASQASCLSTTVANGKTEQSTQQRISLRQSYESLYTIFACIVTRKLQEMLQSEAGKSLRYRIDSFAVNSYLLNSKKAERGSLEAPTFEYQTEGICLKKSKHLKKWDRRFMRLRDHQLKSYKISYQTAKPTRNSGSWGRQQQSKNYEISKQSTFQVQEIRELWTRFEVIDREFLVMKMFGESKLEKIEIGIPVANFADVKRSGNWLFGLVGMLQAGP